MYFFFDLAGVFSKQDFTASPKQIKKHLLHCYGLFNRGDYVRKQRHKWGVQKCSLKYQNET